MSLPFARPGISSVMSLAVIIRLRIPLLMSLIKYYNFDVEIPFVELCRFRLPSRYLQEIKLWGHDRSISRSVFIQLRCIETSALVRVEIIHSRAASEGWKNVQQHWDVFALSFFAVRFANVWRLTSTFFLTMYRACFVEFSVFHLPFSNEKSR